MYIRANHWSFAAVVEFYSRLPLQSLQAVCNKLETKWAAGGNRRDNSLYSALFDVMWHNKPLLDRVRKACGDALNLEGSRVGKFVQLTNALRLQNPPRTAAGALTADPVFPAYNSTTCNQFHHLYLGALVCYSNALGTLQKTVARNNRATHEYYHPQKEGSLTLEPIVGPLEDVWACSTLLWRITTSHMFELHTMVIAKMMDTHRAPIPTMPMAEQLPKFPLRFDRGKASDGGRVSRTNGGGTDGGNYHGEPAAESVEPAAESVEPAAESVEPAEESVEPAAESLEQQLAEGVFEPNGQFTHALKSWAEMHVSHFKALRILTAHHGPDPTQVAINLIAVKKEQKVIELPWRSTLCELMKSRAPHLNSEEVANDIQQQIDSSENVTAHGSFGKSEAPEHSDAVGEGKPLAQSDAKGGGKPRGQKDRGKGKEPRKAGMVAFSAGTHSEISFAALMAELEMAIKDNEKESAEQLRATIQVRSPGYFHAIAQMST
jgi:hypothetical protein